jgi:hypothetical protein
MVLVFLNLSLVNFFDDDDGAGTRGAGDGRGSLARRSSSGGPTPSSPGRLRSDLAEELLETNWRARTHFLYFSSQSQPPIHWSLVFPEHSVSILLKKHSFFNKK